MAEISSLMCPVEPQTVLHRLQKKGLLTFCLGHPEIYLFFIRRLFHSEPQTLEGRTARCQVNGVLHGARIQTVGFMPGVRVE